MVTERRLSRGQNPRNEVSVKPGLAQASIRVLPQVVRDLALMLCDGGECIQDVAARRGQATLLALVFETTAHRAVESIDEGGWRGCALAERGRGRRSGGREPAGSGCCSTSTPRCSPPTRRRSKRPDNWEGGFRFGVLLWFPAGPDDGLAGLLRPGHAGSNTAKDHEQVSIGPLEELRRKVLYEEIPVPCNVGGGHEFKQAFPRPENPLLRHLPS
jgi:hypothetical protein